MREQKCFVAELKSKDKVISVY